MRERGGGLSDCLSREKGIFCGRGVLDSGGAFDLDTMLLWRPRGGLGDDS